MIPCLILIGGQYVDPSKVIAVLTPTSHHVPLTDGADLPLRSVLVLDRAVQPLVPCSASPKTAAEKIQGWFQEIEDENERRAREWAEKHAGDSQPTPSAASPSPFGQSAPVDDDDTPHEPETASKRK